MKTKQPLGINVLAAAKKRIEYTFDNFDKISVSFSGGKDSTVMFHLVAEEAIRRNRKIGVLIVDLEAQYSSTIEHIEEMIEKYKNVIDLHWVCLPISLSNAVSNFEPRWKCWDSDKKDIWVRGLPENSISDVDYYEFFEDGMEFEEFVPLWSEWFAGDEKTASFVGIRADESLNRFRTICTFNKETFNSKRWTTKVTDNVYNIYPVYDWKTRDIWVYHAKTNHPSNPVYDSMNKAGVPLSQQRLCQPYGSDQRRGLYLYHILEPDTWYKLLVRVNGVNSGALYVTEGGNVMGYGAITKPIGHTWKSFFNLIFSTMPKQTREHYIPRFRTFVQGWMKRGYEEGIPDEAPRVLENKHWAPSYKRLCKTLLRNDWWCKGLGLQQPKSEAYGKYLEIKKNRKRKKELES